MSARDIYYVMSETSPCPSCKAELKDRVARVSENDGWTLIRKGADRTVTGCSACLTGRDLMDLIHYTSFIEKTNDKGHEKRALEHIEKNLERHGLQHTARKYGMMLVPANNVEDSDTMGCLNEP